jgi:hypothetical protein
LTINSIEIGGAIYKRPATARAAPKTPPTAGMAMCWAPAEEVAEEAELATELVLEAMDEPAEPTALVADEVIEACWLERLAAFEESEAAAEPVAVASSEVTLL